MVFSNSLKPKPSSTTTYEKNPKIFWNTHNENG